MTNDVVVTGIGFVNALGRSTQEVWSAMLAGTHGTGTIRAYDASALRTQVGGEAQDIKLRRELPYPRGARLMNRAARFAVGALQSALADADLDSSPERRREVAIYLASENQISGPQHILPAVRRAWNSRTESVDYKELGDASSDMYPLFFLEGLPGAALYFASEQFGIAGPNTFYSGGADAGANTIGGAYRDIRSGAAEVAVAGAFDDATSWWPAIASDATGDLAPAGPGDFDAYRPFDSQANGRVLGDGACMLVLESRSHAEARGARVYAAIDGLGFGRTRRRTQEHTSGFDTAIRASTPADLNSVTVDVVYSSGAAHATTDAHEARAIGRALGQPLVTCAHPATGHQQSSAGTFNVALAALSVAHGAVPPTLNLRYPARHAPTRLITDEAVHTTVDRAVALANGPHGQAASVSLRSLDI